MDPLDLIPQGDPEWTVCLPQETLVGLAIRGLSDLLVLGIREDEFGYPVSCTMMSHVELDVHP